MSRHDAPPETDVQRQAREWWTTRLGPCAVGWGRDKQGKFLSEFARNAEAAWAAALDTRATSGGDSASLEQRARELLARELDSIGYPKSAKDLRAGASLEEHVVLSACIRAITAALANQQGVENEV